MVSIGGQMRNLMDFIYQLEKFLVLQCFKLLNKLPPSGNLRKDFNYETKSLPEVSGRHEMIKMIIIN